MVFIESKKTHIINCITVQYLFVFCCRCVFFCKTVTCYSVEQFPHHINPYCTSVLYISFCMMYVYWMTQYNIKMSLCMSYWSNFGDWYMHILAIKCHIVLLHCHCSWREVDELYIFCCCYMGAGSAGVCLGWNGRKRVLKSRTYTVILLQVDLLDVRNVVKQGRVEWKKRA
jgi:hypothetical protein